MEKSAGMEKVLFVGGRRGLGAEVAQAWHSRFPQDSLAISSRQNFESAIAQTVLCDFAKPAQVDDLLKFIETFRPQRLFCFAGGGPHGVFEDKAWKDHAWAMQVSLLAPMQVIHTCLLLPEVHQVIMVGSAIAESSADKNAASYSAAKHGLKGLLTTLRAELDQKKTPLKDFRLFSPGYMATDMLPISAREGKKVAEVADVAREFINWALDKEASWHRLYQPD